MVAAQAEGDADLFELLLRTGDDRLVLGQRISEWCGHAPILEEDIALANFALDFVGQANLLLQLAGAVEGKGRNQDELAYFREALDFRNVQLVELPNGDFAYTMMRQFLFDAYDVPFLDGLSRSTHQELAGIAAKALKEAKYHLRHSAEWVIKLGDGTEESHRRAQEALDHLWRFTPELFAQDDVHTRLAAAGMVPALADLEPVWLERVQAVLGRATLEAPGDARAMVQGRQGRHTEHLGHLLAEMQIVARSFPDATW